jgi:alkylation response protein AidB-like acyl-CoA dehydrogenase
MTTRTLFGPEHDAYRDQVRRFIEREVVPHEAAWSAAGIVSRDLWLRAGAAGFLCPSLPEAYGGGGGDRLHSLIVTEELCRAGAYGPGFAMHSDIVAPYIENHGDEEQKQRFLPRMARGEAIGAIAMTEPGAGSDLQGIMTRAIRDGDVYRLSGQKTFISNGILADVIVVAVKTDPQQGGKGISLVIVEGDRPGLRRGRNLQKLGAHAQDTAELFFEDVQVPVANRLGEEGQGMRLMMRELAWERLQIAVMAAALMESALGWTLDFVRTRRAFGQAVIDFQNTRFKLAEIKTRVEIARVYVDRCIADMMAGQLDPVTAAQAKLWTTETQSEVLDECLQLHGGYGYMWDYPICRAYADTRIQRIFGGTNEIMREIIGRSLATA